MRRLAAPPHESVDFPDVIWKLTKNGCLAEARMRPVPWGESSRPEFRMRCSIQRRHFS